MPVVDSLDVFAENNLSVKVPHRVRKTLMEIRQVELVEIEGFRDIYRSEMGCQIIHDSIHSRRGWSNEYLLIEGSANIGYASIAVGGPWREIPTVYEFFVLSQYRLRLFEIFEGLLALNNATMIETQSNDVLLTTMLHTFAKDVSSESILFDDKLTTSYCVHEAIFRRTTSDDSLQISEQKLACEAKWCVSVGGLIAGAGDILFHYNRPYGDIYMEVAEPFRRRGIGTYLVQELKRVCYKGGSIPAARCNPKNFASRRTLQKAGFVPCGHILKGTIPQ